MHALPEARVDVRAHRGLDLLADHLELPLAHDRWTLSATAHRSEEVGVVRDHALMQIAVARHADHLVRVGRPRDVVAPLAVRALEAQVDLHVVVQRDLEVHLLLPVGALGLDHALGANEPVWRSSEPGRVLVHVQASLLDEVARVRAVGEDRVRLVVAAPARRIVALEGVRAHRALKRDLAARPQAQAQCGSDVRGGQLALARRVPLRRALLKRSRHGSDRYFRIACMRKSRVEIASKTFEFHSAISPPRALQMEKKSGRKRKVELKTTLSECE